MELHTGARDLGLILVLTVSDCVDSFDFVDRGRSVGVDRGGDVAG